MPKAEKEVKEVVVKKTAQAVMPKLEKEIVVEKTTETFSATKKGTHSLGRGRR